MSLCAACIEARLRCGADFPDLGWRRDVNLAVVGSGFLSDCSWKGRAENPDYHQTPWQTAHLKQMSVK